MQLCGRELIGVQKILQSVAKSDPTTSPIPASKPNDGKTHGTHDQYAAFHKPKPDLNMPAAYLYDA